MAYTTTIIDGKKIVLDENGKPCRTCNTLKDLMGVAGAAGVPASAAKPSVPAADPYKAAPPDGGELGKSTWTFLHSLPSQYPERANDSEQAVMGYFLHLFGEVYPCPPCAADFRDYIEEHPPRLSGKNELGQWLCEAHNDVNAKLGKPSFDCRTWRERWLDGWTKK